MDRPAAVTLVGRELELARLRSALREARAGHTQLVIIDGAAGIGKSVLLLEFLATSAALASVAWLRCDQLEQNLAFSAAELLLQEPVEPGCSELEVGRRLLARLGVLTTEVGDGVAW